MQRLGSVFRGNAQEMSVGAGVNAAHKRFGLRDVSPKIYHRARIGLICHLLPSVLWTVYVFLSFQSRSALEKHTLDK